MLKKLNNKGMTLVEVVVCFALVTIVLTSMYSTISVYKTKQNIESYKETITTYKNLLTKEIQDDIIKKGLISASIAEDNPTNPEKYTITMNFKDASSKALEIIRIKAEDAFEGDYTNSFVYLGDMNRNGTFETVDIEGYDSGDGDYADEGESVGIRTCIDHSTLCDENDKKIADTDENGTLNNDDWNGGFDAQEALVASGLIPKAYEISALGSSTKNDEFSITYGGVEYPFPDIGNTKNDYGNTVYDLRINNVNLSTENNILSIYIGFYHPELLTRYAIDIVCPINYS